jgi:hypothetical protein
MSNAKDVQDAVVWAREVHALGMEIVTAHPRRSTAQTMAVPMMMTSRAMNALDSVMLLVQGGHTTDAFSIMRSVCELAIDLGYMAAADTEARMELFADHIFVARHRLLKVLDDAGQTNPSPEFAARMKSIYERVKGNYDNKGNWANKRIDQRAAEAGKKAFYDILHRLGSGASHSCAEALWWECTETTVNGEKAIVSRLGDYSTPDASPLLFATLALFDLLTTLVGLLGLDFDERLVTVMSKCPGVDTALFRNEIAEIKAAQAAG